MKMHILCAIGVIGISACARIPEEPANLSTVHYVVPSHAQANFNSKHSSGDGADKAGTGGTRRQLETGNQRFILGRGEHPRQSVARRVELRAGQKPHTIVLSCSDSRVPPEVIFDQGLGDLFVVRTAGEVADASAVASIEYAVEHLAVRALVIMGHQSCGAVKAAVTTPQGKTAGSADLDALVSAIRPNLKGLSSVERDPKYDSTLTAASKAQVRGVKQQLLKRSKIVNEAVHHHGLEIMQAIYHLETGEVEFF